MEVNGFIFDTSSWIDIWRKYRDKFPDISWLERLIAQDVASGIIKSPPKVRDELEKREDDMAYQWVKSKEEIFSISGIDQTKIQKLVEEYYAFSQAVKIEREKGLSETDANVIAYAKIMGYTVITEERSKGKKRKGNIVYVCQEKGIRCGNFLVYLQDKGIR